MNLPTMKKKYFWAAIPALLLAVGALAVGTAINQGEEVSVPAGTEIHVRLSQSLSTSRETSGDTFEATVADPVMIDGKTVIPRDAPVTGQIVSVRESGRLAGVARMRLTLKSVEVDGKEYELRTGDFSERGGNHRKRNWAFIGGGAGGGALIGVLAAGGKGAAIGGPIGAGVGIAAATLTGKKDFVLPAETGLIFELADPVKVEVKS
jgi:hypothetical protein